MFTRTRFAAIGVILALVAVVSIGAANVSAATTPIIDGDVNGIELCPQYRCGMAVFIGRFDGWVGNVYDPNGVWRIAVRHRALAREIGGATEIMFGLFSLDAAGETFKGYVKGTLTTVEVGTGLLMKGAIFDIEATLTLTRGGTGTLHFDGVLDHTRIPLVTVDGTISQ